MTTHYWLPTTLTLVIGLAVWAITWILPLIFMVAMALGCETQARAQRQRALAFYEGEASTTMPRSTSPAKAKTRGTTHARSCAAPRSLSRWPSRSRSSHTSITSATRRASPGSARWITRRSVHRDRNRGVGRPAVGAQPDSAGCAEALSASLRVDSASRPPGPTISSFRSASLHGSSSFLADAGWGLGS